MLHINKFKWISYGVDKLPTPITLIYLYGLHPTYNNHIDSIKFQFVTLNNTPLILRYSNLVGVFSSNTLIIDTPLQAGKFIHTFHYIDDIIDFILYIQINQYFHQSENIKLLTFPVYNSNSTNLSIIVPKSKYLITKITINFPISPILLISSFGTGIITDNILTFNSPTISCVYNFINLAENFTSMINCIEITYFYSHTKKLYPPMIYKIIPI